MASHDVDLCLIPEVDIDLYDDQYGVLPHVRRCLERQHHCVIVISEGITLPGLKGEVMMQCISMMNRKAPMQVEIVVIQMSVSI